MTPNLTSYKKYTGSSKLPQNCLVAMLRHIQFNHPKIKSHDPNNHQNATQNFPNNTEIFHTKTPTIISIPTCKYYHHSNNQIKINCHVKYQRHTHILNNSFPTRTLTTSIGEHLNSVFNSTPKNQPEMAQPYFIKSTAFPHHSSLKALIFLI